MTLIDRLAAQRDRETGSLAPAALAAWREQLLPALARWPVRSPYNRVPPALKQAYKAIIEAHGPATAAAALRAAVFDSLTICRATLQDSVWRGTVPFLDEAATQLCTEAEAGEYNPGLERDDDLKDLAVATGRLKACGAFVVEPESGIERSRLVRSGLRPLVMGAIYIARAGGREPYFESHLYTRLLGHFSSDERWKSYKLLAGVMKQLRDIRGFTAVSWYFDPALAQVSPRLAYLHETLLANGAWLVPVETSASGVRSALGRSPTRRRLHAEGKYRPREYLVIWPRRAMIAAFGD